MEWLMGLSPEARTAYSLGRSGPDALQAPAPLAVALPMLVAERFVDARLRARRGRREKVVVATASFAAVYVTQRASERARLRRGRALGLTAETAPRPAPGWLTLGELAARVLLVGIQQLWTRHQTGRWARASHSSLLAAAVIREIRIRHSWRAAYSRTARSR
jgi:hypothetical protein